MTLAAVCMSHSPLLGITHPPADVEQAVDDAFARCRGFVERFDPTLVVSFGPDHYNGFFHDLMPPFCIGLDAVSVGDYGTEAGPLDVPAETAEGMARHVLASDVDVAVSRRMEIDHGAVQPLEILLGGISARPTVPVFVNAVADPFAPMRRVGRLGAAIGAFLGGLSGERVLIVGSGGLSHDPPVPRWASATGEQRAMLLDGRHPTAAARDARQQRVVDTARRFAAGTAEIRDLNPEWDQRFLDLCTRGELETIERFEAPDMAAEAGNSVHEVRTWLAALSALRAAAGGYQVEDHFYRPVPEYIAGFGTLTATGVRG